MEKHPTIVIKTKTSNRLLNQRSLTEERNEEEVIKRK